MIQHIKNFWKRYVVSAIGFPVAFAGGLEMGKQLTPPSVDCKGLTCVVQLKYDENGERGTITYVEQEFNTKTTANDLRADIQKRIDDKRKFIEEQSKLEAPNEDITK